MIEIQADDSILSLLPSGVDLESVLSQAARETLLYSQLNPDEVELTLLLSDDDQLQQLNQKFLETNSPTDVLSFPEDYIDPESGRRYLGDIAISLPRATAQAEAGGHPVTAELQLLTVHGVLHLLGHDHAEPDQKQLMWTAQSVVLTRLGSPITTPPETE